LDTNDLFVFLTIASILHDILSYNLVFWLPFELDGPLS